MKTLLFVAILLLPAFSLTAQTSLKEGPTVNGVRLGATQNEVRARFGKPLSQERREAEPCVGGTELTMRYRGAVITLWDDPNDASRFTVGRIEVTSAAWPVSGVRVGQSSGSVRTKFGKPDAQEPDQRTKLSVWYYEMTDDSPGNTHFTFRNGKLIKITAIYLMC